jgi:hypothetical protein
MEQISVREKLKEIALSDAVNSLRAQDTLREAMVAALVNKASEMSPDSIIEAMAKLDGSMKLDRYKQVLNLLGD